MLKTTIAGIIAATAGAFFSLASAQAQDVGIAASNPGSIYHTTASAVAKMANDKAGLRATVQPFASATIYLPAVAAGEYAFGITNEDELRLAVTGKGHFKGRVYDNLRAESLLYPLRVAFFLRDKSNIKTMADLKGKRITTGFTSQKTIPAMLVAQLETGGLTMSDIKGVKVPNVVGGAAVAGRGEGF